MLARISYAGAALFVAAVVVAGALYPGYSHLKEAASQLAATNSPSAPIMIVGFFALATSTVAAGLGLFQHLPVGAAAKIAGVLTLISGALLVVAGLARNSCSEWIGACKAAEEAGTIPLHHVVHDLVSLLLFLLLIAAVFTLARAVARNGARKLVWPSIAVGVVSFVTMVAMVSGAVPAASGLLQRVFLLVLFGWIIAVGPLTARIRAAGMPAAGAALQRPVEVL
ncbi:DUF998 domain-containing protein [Dactylosporangium sp. NPDC049525]|uniref:DUF998 domain-containing protein n=1 Tax=Dactylosporangium sp. NPDC049525 TaxID=3154730 RepID=UPI00342C660D